MAKDIYDVIVVGAGHAGCEAALAAARMGCRSLLVTLDADKMALLSCNPAIGGIGKGQLVKEVDALGGQMGRAADACGIQFRTLNASKGAAVWSSRAQVDRTKYALYMQGVLRDERHLEIRAGQVIGLRVEEMVIRGVELAGGLKLSAKTVIITPGTFLNGLIHIGMRSFPGGRIEEQEVTKGLSESLRALGFPLLRFKTGTCARLDGKTIDFSRLEAQDGDIPPRPFSFSTKALHLKQVPCYITYTQEETHRIVRENLKHSPLFSGKITGTGVRYCPSFEDKVVKFAHHLRHQVFLEPEGLATDEYYPNGLSTSLPEEVQEKFIHSIAGLEKVKIKRYGYGIEHDVVEATQLYPTLETKPVKNLYLAGQINGTTGYEEAAAQGLVAGINVALRVKAKPPFILDRATSYIGVLLDDLTTKGTPEPYRMFTSRVEYRLILREDNADIRLRKSGYELGLVSKKDYAHTQQKQKQITQGLSYLKTVSQLNRRTALNSNGEVSPKLTFFQLLKRPHVRIKDLPIKFPFRVSAEVLHGIETEVKYSGFIPRQLKEVRSFKHLEKIKIPPEFDYDSVNGLSREIKEKLNKFKPLTLGQANRISGVTPVAIMLLVVYLKNRPQTKHKKNQQRYSKFSEYLSQRFGCRVYKVSIDAGFSCPNRDGRVGKDGCIFCDNRGFSFHSRLGHRPIETQIKEGIEFGRKRFKAEKFIVYFQAHTNTYAPLAELRDKYDKVRAFKDVVGLAIGTRPDCVDPKILDLIASYTEDYEVWLEYGLQSIHEKSLQLINRGHTYAAFLKAVEETRKRNKLKLCAHIILGLPAEKEDDILATAKEMGRLKLEGLKIHPLHIIKGTRLEEMFKRREYSPLTLEEYIEYCTKFLEYLWPETVIQRLGADCPREYLVAPLWILQKNELLQQIEQRLAQSKRFQGRLYGA